MKVTGSTIQQLERDKPKSRCRKWRLWATTEQGRRSRRFHGTWTQACEALKAFVAELEGFVPNAETFGAYAESWRAWRADSGDLAPGTVANDARHVAALRRTDLDGMRMDSITPADCRDALLWLKSHPARSTRTGQLSNTTMNKLHTCLHSVFECAHGDGAISTNPMASVKAPRPDTREKDAMSPDELFAFLDAVDGLPLDGRAVALYLMATLGLWRSEACALLDSDIGDGLCRVHLAVKERNGRVDEPKSPASIRVLPVQPRLQRKVDEWRAVKPDGATIACNSVGGVLRPQLLQRWWSGDSKHVGVRSSLGCDGMTLHQLRHSNLSMMARYMSPFDLQRYAGWSSIAPARIYIHDDLDSVRAAVSCAWDAIECTKYAPENEKGQSA